MRNSARVRLTKGMPARLLTSSAGGYLLESVRITGLASYEGDKMRRSLYVFPICGVFLILTIPGSDYSIIRYEGSPLIVRMTIVLYSARFFARPVLDVSNCTTMIPLTKIDNC